MPDSYTVPSYGGSGDKLLGFLLDAVAEGEIWLKAQRPTTEWDSILDVLGPNYDGGTPPAVGQSGTGYNKVRQEYAELRASLSNFKHAGEFGPTEDDAQEFFERAHMLTNLDRNWERTTFANLVVRDVVGTALAKGTAYFYEDWDPAFWGAGRGDIRLACVDPADVTFIQLPRNHNIQQAYITLIKQEIPLQLARRMYAKYPAFAANLRPDHDSPGWIAKGLRRVQQFISPALRAGGSIRKQNDSFPTVDIWQAYICDGSINENASAVQMGAKDTNWSYTVPALGDPIPQGIINPATGQQWTLPATPDDCLLFPLRRLTIFSRTGVATDGSSPWWHGATPLARLRFKDLPWEALGASQVGDAVTMQNGVIQIMRSVENSIAARLDPAGIYDDSRVDKTWAEAFNPMKAGARASADLSNGSPIEFPMQPGQYDVPPFIIGEGGYVRQQEDRMDYVTSARDLIAVAKARQIPSSDTLEKLLEMAGPVVQDMVGALVHPLTQLGEWRKAYYFQFYTKARMLKISDPEGAELTGNIRYVPESLIPYQHGETPETRTARARAYLSDYSYEVSESGVSELNRMSQTLLYVQLKKLGFPLSNYTLAKIARVPNYGPPPKGTNTEFERWVAEQRIDMELKIEFAKEMQEAGGGAPPDGAAPGEGQEGAGRKPSFQKPPRLVSKDSGARSTITTS